jgi:AcrR family transcriptional regulator
MDRAELAAEVAKHAHGKVPSELRRRQILAEAQALFVERGYHRASMDELARRVGVSKPVVYNLGGSKEQLFRDVMAAINAELAAALVAATGPETTLEGKLRAGIGAFLAFVRDRRQGWLALLSTEAGPASREVADMRRRQAALVAGLIADQTGAVDPSLLEPLGLAINGAIELAASWWLDHDEVPSDALADLLTQLLARGLLSLREP